MSIRDVLISGIEQLNRDLDRALDGLSKDQVNHRPGGAALSPGFNAWHAWRTQDNIANFVLQKKQTVWIEDGYVDKLGLPKVAQGTGMAGEDAQGIVISDPTLLREYGQKVGTSCVDYLRNVSDEDLEEVTLVKPLGEMPRWRAFSQVLIGHCNQHLGEINLVRGMLEIGSADDHRP